MFVDWQACWDANSEPEKMYSYKPGPRAPMSSTGETAWAAQWVQDTADSLPTPWIPNLQKGCSLSQTESLLQAPCLCLPSLRNVLVKVKHVNSEREQWIVTLVHCYANVTQIGVLNLALMMPSCFPDTHSEMQCTDVSLLWTPITHCPSQRGGLLAATIAALIAMERAPLKDVI